MTTLIVDAARAYVAARHSVDQAGSGEMQQCLGQLDGALHDLIFAVDGECFTCESGTCPADIPQRQTKGAA